MLQVSTTRFLEHGAAHEALSIVGGPALGTNACGRVSSIAFTTSFAVIETAQMALGID